MTIQEFITRLKITMQATQVDHNPNTDDSNWARTASHWRCTFRLAGRRFTTPFSMGSALTGPPTAAGVLNCLASHASGADQAFSGWARDYGYDTDSIKALKTYRAIKRQSAKLRRFLGSTAAFDTLLACKRL